MKNSELLAPAGSPQALIAAVRCGAQAVYLGAGRFHARQNAQGFDGDALKEAIAYCHARGVQVHLTLNTLVREEEFSAAFKEAERACSLGADALIVQDRGLARAIHCAAPSMPLHASTQLSCHTPKGVEALREAGFSRVVLAREMSAREIAACCGLGCETEVFVHGALCMCVSGQCFFSATLGGRSGNRGRCAQPCRLPFSTDGRPHAQEYALSLKDLSLWEQLPALREMGVCSFKIEGRMKRPEYVAAATAVCRAALDGKPVDPVLVSDLRAVFSRSGFTDGYYTGRRDKTMFGSRTKEDVAAAAPVLRRLEKLYEKETPRVPLSMKMTAERERPLALTVSDTDGHTVSVLGECVRTSDRPLSSERLRVQLQKLGGTPFYLPDDAVSVTVAERSDVPLSAVNALRREAVQRLLEERAAAKPIDFVRRDISLPAVSFSALPKLVVRLSDISQLSDALCDNAALVTLPLRTFPKQLGDAARRVTVAAEIPRALFGQEETVLRRLSAARAAGAVAAVCHNAGAIPLAKAAGLPAVGGFGLYVCNREAAAAYREDGLIAATLSFELSLRQMTFAASAPLPLGMFCYGRQPLMLLRCCPQRAAHGCAGCGGRRGLTDRKGVFFPLACTDGCPELLNSVPLYLADRSQAFPPLAFWTLYMTDETASRAAQVTAWYAAAARGRTVSPAQTAFGQDGFTRGLAFRGVE